MGWAGFERVGDGEDAQTHFAYVGMDVDCGCDDSDRTRREEEAFGGGTFKLGGLFAGLSLSTHARRRNSEVRSSAFVVGLWVLTSRSSFCRRLVS